MNLNERLIDLRKKRGLSQQEFAEKLNVTRQTVSKWESGATLPNGERLIQLSKLYGVTVEYLMNGTGEPPTLPESAQESAKPKKRKWGVAAAAVVALLLATILYFATSEEDARQPNPIEGLKTEQVDSIPKDQFQFG